MTQIQTSFIPGAEFVIVSHHTYYCISGKLATKLRLTARERHQPMAELVRAALSAYLDGQRRREAEGQAHRTVANGTADGQAQVGKRVDTPEHAHGAVAPRCPEHRPPMA